MISKDSIIYSVLWKPRMSFRLPQSYVLISMVISAPFLMILPLLYKWIPLLTFFLIGKIKTAQDPYFFDIWLNKRLNQPQTNQHKKIWDGNAYYP
ncbi:VirB3 family type IV secretion system protein [Pseudodesulfovibrio senegalensis]|uniref:Type IV secretion system protein VirB3 n=1 Tax=Pseudodesulfovibrio senegalensis TaxID=1721087 RepID=A0A6N6MZ37_9BACT|nr:hypothetical protein F8A88_15335 [Pseudodesulfovibrio senegalensis]